ncbi:MAG: carboxyltransferase domain-containing protein [Devosia sp.]
MSEAITPTLMPLGDRALLVRFAEGVSDAANRAAIGLARRLAADRLEGVEEIAPGLVSVLIRTSLGVDTRRLQGEIMLRVGLEDAPGAASEHSIAVTLDGEDLGEVSGRLGLSTDEFAHQHGALPLRVLATGFAPGFVYCGFHGTDLVVPRREHVRPVVPAGTVLFAAGQTAIAATPVRTGWHIIGRTGFQNFDPAMTPPTRLAAGDSLRFVPA